jgi:hypothetical protein
LAFEADEEGRVKRTDGELRSAAEAIRKRFVAALNARKEFDPVEAREMQELLIRADQAWLRARGWSPMPWRTIPYNKRYGDCEYTEREWRRGRDVIYEYPFGFWRSADKQRGCSSVDVIVGTDRKWQLSLEME